MKVIDLSPLRKVSFEEKTKAKNFSRVIAEPFEKGFGHTIGNALRRVLVSSIEGAAITSVKISDVMHEYVSVKGVKEDAMGIILNLKKVRIKLFSDEPEIVRLSAKSKSEVTAGDIEGNPNIEVVNPEHVIAHLNAGATLDMELTIERGYGYATSEENKKANRPAGTIFMDSLFSPIVKVNYEVENTRVDRFTDFEKIIFDIWTDGTIEVKDAIAYSARTLGGMLSVFTETSGVLKENKTAIASEKALDEIIDEKTKEKLEESVDILGLGTRPRNCIEKAGVKTIRDLIEKTEEELLSKKFEGMGKSSVKEIKEKLKEIGLSLASESAAKNKS